MYIESPVLWPALDCYLPVPSGIQAAAGEGSFDSHMRILQSKDAIAKRLKGVPLDTVSIAPNILEKMEIDPKTYGEVMKQIDIYTKTYKERNTPGVETITFSIDSDGVPCIKGVNEFVKKNMQRLSGITSDDSDASDSLFGMLRQAAYALDIDANYELAMTYYIKKNAGIE